MALLVCRERVEREGGGVGACASHTRSALPSAFIFLSLAKAPFSKLGSPFLSGLPALLGDMSTHTPRCPKPLARAA